MRKYSAIIKQSTFTKYTKSNKKGLKYEDKDIYSWR